MDGHFGLNFEATRKHWVSLDECERKRSVTGHDVGDVRMEQAVDGTAYQAVAKVVEWSLVLLEICGAQAVTDYHVIAFKHFINHGWRRISRVSIIAVCHDIYVGVNVFEHGANHVAFALARFLSYNRTFGHSDFGSAISGVVVIHIDVGMRQCCFEVAYHLADGDFLVIARQQYGNGGACILLEHVEHYSLCCGRSEASCGFNYDCCLLGKGYEGMA